MAKLATTMMITRTRTFIHHTYNKTVKRMKMNLPSRSALAQLKAIQVQVRPPILQIHSQDYIRLRAWETKSKKLRARPRRAKKRCLHSKNKMLIIK
jgi:hypothetical protein